MVPKRPSGGSLSVSVIIPVYKGGSEFAACLSSLAQAWPKADEVIIVADGESDGSWRLAENYGYKVLRRPKRGGPAAARNLGALEAVGDILFFVDADVAVHRETIGLVSSAFAEDPGLGVVIGSYDDQPVAEGFFSQYKNLFHHFIHQMANVEGSTFWAGCGAIRREIFFSLNGYDESYPVPSIEDIELGYRLKQEGYSIFVKKDLQVKHLKIWGFVSLLKTDFFNRALPWTELILRKKRLINDLNLRFSSRLSAVMVFVLLALLVGALFDPRLIVLAGLLGILILAVNISLYLFFLKKKGLWFTLRAIPLHWLYYIYSALAFSLGTARYFSRRAVLAGCSGSSLSGDRRKGTTDDQSWR